MHTLEAGSYLCFSVSCQRALNSSFNVCCCMPASLSCCLREDTSFSFCHPDFIIVALRFFFKESFVYFSPPQPLGDYAQSLAFFLSPLFQVMILSLSAYLALLCLQHKVSCLCQLGQLDVSYIHTGNIVILHIVASHNIDSMSLMMLSKPVCTCFVCTLQRPSWSKHRTITTYTVLRESSTSSMTFESVAMNHITKQYYYYYVHMMMQ